MIRPWLIHIRPFVMPTENRDELAMIAVGMSREEYADKIWKIRDDAFGPVRKSHRKNWPVKQGSKASKSNITRLDKARARA